MSKKKTAIYVRVSVLKEEAVSPQMQMDKAKQYCQLHDEKYEVFQDLDFSGKDTNRPAFQQMVSHIKMGLISKLVVYRLDRVSRSVKTWPFLWIC
jgi:DNA invertase Pin-like site-specific DNA recombinase